MVLIITSMGPVNGTKLRAGRSLNSYNLRLAGNCISVFLSNGKMDAGLLTQSNFFMNG